VPAGRGGGNGGRGLPQAPHDPAVRRLHHGVPRPAAARARPAHQRKLRDIELSIRGILPRTRSARAPAGGSLRDGFGLKVGEVSKGWFAARARELIGGHEMLEAVIGAMLTARESLQAEFLHLNRRMLAIVRADAVWWQLMTAPGVGPVVAATYKTAVDNPSRFKKSKEVGPYFGLMPRKYQSGETDWAGHISKAGDTAARTVLYEAAKLYEAANVMLTRTMRFSVLNAWAVDVAKRQGLRKARGALARKLAVVLHRMWIDGAEFRWSNAPSNVAWPDRTRRGAYRRALPPSGNEVPSQGRGSDEAAESEVARSRSGPRALDRLVRPN
jgi:transposase